MEGACSTLVVPQTPDLPRRGQRTTIKKAKKMSSVKCIRSRACAVLHRFHIVCISSGIQIAQFLICHMFRLFSVLVGSPYDFAPGRKVHRYLHI